MAELFGSEVGGCTGLRSLALLGERREKSGQGDNAIVQGLLPARDGEPTCLGVWRTMCPPAFSPRLSRQPCVLGHSEIGSIEILFPVGCRISVSMGGGNFGQSGPTDAQTSKAHLALPSLDSPASITTVCYYFPHHPNIVHHCATQCLQRAPSLFPTALFHPLLPHRRHPTNLPPLLNRQAQLGLLLLSVALEPAISARVTPAGKWWTSPLEGNITLLTSPKGTQSPRE